MLCVGDATVKCNKEEVSLSEGAAEKLKKLWAGGDFKGVVKYATRLLRSHPDSFYVHTLLAEAYRKLEQPEGALRSYRNALEFNRQLPEAYNNLGAFLISRGDLVSAKSVLSKGLVRAPKNVELLNNMGNVLKAEGELEGAIGYYEQALSFGGLNASILHNAANVKKAQGDARAAIALYSKALSVDPRLFDAALGLADVLVAECNFDKAVDYYKMALALQPASGKALLGLGGALEATGHDDAAIKAFLAAATSEADADKAYRRSANFFKERHQYEAARKCYLKLIELDGKDVSAHIELSICYKKMRKLDAAREVLENAIVACGERAEIYGNLANVYEDMKNLDDCIVAYDRAIELAPDNIGYRIARLGILLRVCAWSKIDSEVTICEKSLLDKDVSPFTLLAVEDEPARHLIRSRNVGSKAESLAPSVPAFQARERQERLRVGYFSSDFRNHPVSRLIARTLELHDRSKFEVLGYSTATPKIDEMGVRVTKAFDRHVDLSALPDRAAVNFLRKEGLDIAIDLTGYTRDSRSHIFASRVAPVQINYLGYPGSMGVDWMDYIVADTNLIPPRFQQHYSEQPIYLPSHYQAQDDFLELGAPLDRCSLGLPEGSFVFCAINNSYKYSQQSFQIWMRLLLSISDSILWLGGGTDLYKSNVLSAAREAGVSNDRIVFAERRPYSEYVRAFMCADLYLDTFNYNSGATASDVLRAGLPMVTKRGESYTARMASSMVSAIGFPELIADTEAAYEEIALDLASNRSKLTELRENLKICRISSPLFDTETFCRKLELGYQMAYDRHYNGERPAPIWVPK